MSEDWAPIARLNSTFTNACAARAVSVLRWPAMIARASTGAFADRVEEYRHRVDARLDTILSSGATPARLLEAMRYSVLGSGKRVRPLLAYARDRKSTRLNSSHVKSSYA